MVPHTVSTGQWWVPLKIHGVVDLPGGYSAVVLFALSVAGPEWFALHPFRFWFGGGRRGGCGSGGRSLKRSKSKRRRRREEIVVED